MPVQKRGALTVTQRGVVVIAGRCALSEVDGGSGCMACRNPHQSVLKVFDMAIAWATDGMQKAPPA